MTVGDTKKHGKKDEKVSFHAVYKLLGRRVYLLLLFIFGVIIIILILLWRQQAQVVNNSLLMDRTQEWLQSSTLATGDTVTQTFIEQPAESFGQAEMLTINNYGTYLDGQFVKWEDRPRVGDISGSFLEGFTVSADAVALGGDTTGNYIQGITVGAGLGGGGGGGEGVNVALSVQLHQEGGLQFINGQVGLLEGCTDGQLLKWNDITEIWACGSDVSGSGGATLTVREADGSPSVAAAQTLEFGPATGSDGEFIVTSQGGGAARVRTGTAVPLTSADATISGNWTFDGAILANGGLSCGSCIALGSETIGDYLAGVGAGNGVSVAGSGGEGTTPTLSVRLDSSGGLVFEDGGVSLLTTCADGDGLAWDDGGAEWACTASAGAPNTFGSVTADSGTAVADSPNDTLTIAGGNGLVSSGASTPDTVTLDVEVAAGSGLTFNGGALSLLSCSDGEVLKRAAGAWACSGDNNAPSLAYQQQLAGTDNITIGSSLTPIFTDGSGTAQSLPITILSGTKVRISVTVELSSTLATGPVTYAIVRDDNADNDCATGGGDGTQVGGQVTSFIATVAQGFTNSFTFADAGPPATTVRYQICASTSIAIGTASATDRSVSLEQVSF